MFIKSAQKLPKFCKICSQIEMLCYNVVISIVRRGDNMKKKEMIEEPGRQPRRAVKPPSRIQIPETEHSGRAQTSYGYRI